MLNYFLKPINNTTPNAEWTLSDAFQYITGDSAKAATAELRKVLDKAQARSYKAQNFDCVTFAGTFSNRKAANLVKASGLVVLDIDDLSSPNAVENVKQQLVGYKPMPPVLVFTSPSGNGLKAVYHTGKDHDINSYTAAYQYIAEELKKNLQIQVDMAASDIARACFLPHDPDAYYDPGNTISVPSTPPPRPGTSNAANKPNAHSNPKKSSVVKRVDWKKIERCVTDLEAKRTDITVDYDTWIQLGFAFASLGEQGRQYFHRVSALYPDYSVEECDKQFSYCLKNAKGNITIGTFFHFYDELCAKTNADNSYQYGSDDYWTDEKMDVLEKAQNIANGEHAGQLFAPFTKLTGIERNTFQSYGCGLYAIAKDEYKVLIPFNHGSMSLMLDENGEWLIETDPKSKHFDCILGMDLVKNPKWLYVCHSPLDALLLSQILPDYKRAISILAPDQKHISPAQIEKILNDSEKLKTVVFVPDRALVDEGFAYDFIRPLKDKIEDLDINVIDIEVITSEILRNESEVMLENVFHLFHRSNDATQKSVFAKKYHLPVWNSVTQANRFWTVTNKGVVAIDELALSNRLKENGIAKHYFDEQSPTQVVIEDNIVTLPSFIQIFDRYKRVIQQFSAIADVVKVKNGIMKIKSADITNTYLGYRPKALTPTFLGLLEHVDLSFLEDTHDSSYLFYKNCWLRVTQDDIQRMTPSDVKENVMKKSLIDREFNELPDTNPGEFEILVENAMRKDEKRKRSLMTHLGYLLHRHKNSAKAKAVILTDEALTMGDESEGGTGKTIVAKSIDQIRKVKPKNGKTMDTTSRFAFSEVEVGDEVVRLEDLKKDFDFETLFNMITEEMQVEAKYQNRITIPFEDSPKLVITTNRPIKGNGSSFLRRQSVVEFSDHYSETYTPEDDFGHRIYDDWDADQWNRFDHFMIRSLQMFLKEGLIKSTTNYDRNKLITNTSVEFVEWSDTNLEVDHEYDPRELFRGGCILSSLKFVGKPKNAAGNEFLSFHDLHPGTLSDRSQGTFNRWLQRYCDFKNWSLMKPTKKDGYDIYLFTKK